MLTSKSIGTGGLGRFGNQLYTIAGVIGIALRSGQSYGFPKWVNQDNALFGDSRDEMDQFFVNPLPRWIDGVNFQDYGYFWDYRDIILPTGNWSIDAHLQDARYFAHCIDVVREQFRMKNEPEQNDYVAIHYRAGDYQEGKDAYHPRQTKEYYEKAMREFQGCEFMLFSDDRLLWLNMMIDGDPIGWRDKMGIKDLIYYEGTTYIEDFKLMKRCRSFITANSSFSAMAAILGEHPEKKIIMPKLWFGTAANIKFDGYPEGAIII